MNKNKFIIDIETKPDEALIEIFMTKKYDKRDAAIEKMKAGVQEKIDNLPTKYKKQETIDKHSDDLAASIPAKVKEITESYSPAKFRKEMAVSVHFSKIICVGVKELNSLDMPKAYTLEEFAGWIKEKFIGMNDLETGIMQKMEIITFNGRKFDLPNLINNLAKRKLVGPATLRKLRAGNKRYGSGTVLHVDLMEETVESNGTNYSLDEMLRVYCGTKKNTLGEEFFANATDEEIIKHCIEDLEFTAQLYRTLFPVN